MGSSAEESEKEDVGSRKDMLKRAFFHTAEALTRPPSLREVQEACPALPQNKCKALTSASASVLSQVHTELCHALSRVMSRADVVQALASLDASGPPVPASVPSSEMQHAATPDGTELPSLPGGPASLLRAARVQAKREEAESLFQLLDDAQTNAQEKEEELHQLHATAQAAAQRARASSQAFEAEYQAYLRQCETNTPRPGSDGYPASTVAVPNEAAVTLEPARQPSRLQK